MPQEYKLNKSGPYGYSEYGSEKALKNFICLDFQIDKSIIDTWIITEDTITDKNKKELFKYKWIPDIPYPCIALMSTQYKENYYRNPFKATLSIHGTACLQFVKPHANEKLYDVLNRSLSNNMGDPSYFIHKACGAFFQSGYGDPNRDYFMIEFWLSAGVVEYIQFIKESYNT